MNTSAWRHPLGAATRPAGAYHCPPPVRPDAFRCGGREGKFLLMQCHPEDSFTKLSFNKIQIRVFIHDSYLHTR